MQIKITNPKYEYTEGGTLSFSASCEIYSKKKFLLSMPIQSTVSMADADWFAQLSADLVAKGRTLVEMYQQMLAPLAALFPDCNTPSEIAAAFAKNIEGQILEE